MGKAKERWRCVAKDRFVIFYADTPVELAASSRATRSTDPYELRGVMQYNMWKRVSPSNPMSSYPIP